MEANVIEGNREGSYIYYCGDGHYYHFNNGYEYARNEGNSSVLYVRCINYNKNFCNGTAQVSVENGQSHWRNLRRHTCAPSVNHLEVLRLKKAIIQESIENNAGILQTPAEVTNRVRQRFHPNVAAEVTGERMRSSIHRARAAAYPPLPLSLASLGQLLEQHPVLTSIDNGTDSVYGGTVRSPGCTSVVFASRKIRHFMRRVKIIFCFGTFKSRPNSPESAQVLQLSTVMRTARGNTVVPLVHVLMTGKSEEEYVGILRYIQQLVPNFRPQQVMCDYELAMQNAWRQVYNVEVNGCYWHYCRAVLRNAREMGLVPLMNNNRIVRSIVRSVCALPLLPTGLIGRGLDTLIEEARRRDVLPQLHEFFNYVIDTWMRDQILERLSVFGLDHRTNNAAESCNRLLRMNIGGVEIRPRLWKFLSGLRKFITNSHILLRSLARGQQVTTRARKVSAVLYKNTEFHCQSFSRLH